MATLFKWVVRGILFVVLFYAVIFGTSSQMTQGALMTLIGFVVFVLPTVYYVTTKIK